MFVSSACTSRLHDVYPLFVSINMNFLTSCFKQAQTESVENLNANSMPIFLFISNIVGDVDCWKPLEAVVMPAML